MFETGAILIYLADKTGRFLPKDMRGRSSVVQWVMWQMSGLGPMLGQHGHFALYARGEDPLRHRALPRRGGAALSACSTRNSARPAPTSPATYSIADIACFPWTMTHKAQGFTLDDYPNIKRWYAVVRARPQVQAGLAIGKFVKEPFDEEARRNMFGAESEGDGGTEVSLVIAEARATSRARRDPMNPHRAIESPIASRRRLAVTVERATERRRRETRQQRKHP